MARKSMVHKSAKQRRGLAHRVKLGLAPKPKQGVRSYNRCSLCGRPHGYLRKFGICRICFRELAQKGMLTGIKKSSW